MLLLVTLACNAWVQTAEPSVPTTIIEPVFTPTPENIPLTKADVPRVSLEDARVAIESGTAIVLLQNGYTRVTPILGGL